MYSMHNEGKIKKCVYTDKLEVIVNKYNYMYHKIIKMKPADKLTLIKKIIWKVLNVKLVKM